MNPVILWSYLVLGIALIVMGIMEQPLHPTWELALGTVALLLVAVTFFLTRRRKTGRPAAQ